MLPTDQETPLGRETGVAGSGGSSMAGVYLVEHHELARQ